MVLENLAILPLIAMLVLAGCQPSSESKTKGKTPQESSLANKSDPTTKSPAAQVTPPQAKPLATETQTLTETDEETDCFASGTGKVFVPGLGGASGECESSFAAIADQARCNRAVVDPPSKESPFFLNGICYANVASFSNDTCNAQSLFWDGTRCFKSLEDQCTIGKGLVWGKENNYCFASNEEMAQVKKCSDSAGVWADNICYKNYSEIHSEAVCRNILLNKKGAIWVSSSNRCLSDLSQVKDATECQNAKRLGIIGGGMGGNWNGTTCVFCDMFTLWNGTACVVNMPVGN